MSFGQEQVNEKPFIISVASGKGGTGKTTIASNLAALHKNDKVTLIDCDVEEPNSYLFLKHKIERQWAFKTFIPDVDQEKCTFCGKCSELCQFNALLILNKNILVFPELCHGCEGCKLICPENAISDGTKEIGTITEGFMHNIHLFYGFLKIGEAMSPPLIKEVKRVALQDHLSFLVIIDAPPGTSCPVIETVKDSDFVILVTEPTPFGFNDLKLAVEMVRILQIPFGVVINRSTIGDKEVQNYCQKENIPILLEIPNDRAIAEVYSNGNLIVESLPHYRKDFESLLEKIVMKNKSLTMVQP